MSLHPDQESTSPLEVQSFGQVSVKELFGGRAPQRFEVTEGKSIYERIAENQLYLYKVVLPDGTTEVYAFGEPLDGERINALLYFSAPNKFFGFDSKDILDDWRNLYRLKMHANRLKAHRDHIPNWGVFETERIRIWTSIFAWKNLLTSDEKRSFVPVMAWKILPDGQREWIIEKAKLAGWDQVQQAHLASAVSSIKNQYSLLIGSVFMATYSPEVTKNWKSRLSYKLEPEVSPQPTQSMGATQDLPLRAGEITRTCKWRIENAFRRKNVD